MDSSNDAFSRWHAVGLVGMGMAGMAAGSAIADPVQPRAVSTQSMNPDPRSKYPAPPFQEQTQPALARPGQPAELASIYVQLAARDASFTTGNIYGAGGGQGQP